jgi:hypothetical protein
MQMDSEKSLIALGVMDPGAACDDTTSIVSGALNTVIYKGYFTI